MDTPYRPLDDGPERDEEKMPYPKNDCQKFKDLDRTFKTDPNSPLHHDNRCEECK